MIINLRMVDFRLAKNLGRVWNTTLSPGFELLFRLNIVFLPPFTVTTFSSLQLAHNTF